MFRWFKQKLCKHKYGPVSERVLGVTLGWAAFPEVSREFRAVCTCCGYERVSIGYLPRAICKTPRGENDWPLLPDGSRMPIAKHMDPGF